MWACGARYSIVAGAALINDGGNRCAQTASQRHSGCGKGIALTQKLFPPAPHGQQPTPRPPVPRFLPCGCCRSTHWNFRACRRGPPRPAYQHLLVAPHRLRCLSPLTRRRPACGNTTIVNAGIAREAAPKLCPNRCTRSRHPPCPPLTVSGPIPQLWGGAVDPCC